MSRQRTLAKVAAFAMPITPLFALLLMPWLVAWNRQEIGKTLRDRRSLIWWGLLFLSGLVSSLLAVDKRLAAVNFLVPFAIGWFYVLGRSCFPDPTEFLDSMVAGTAVVGLLTVVASLLNVDWAVSGFRLLGGHRGAVLGITDNGLAVVLEAGIAAAVGLLLLDRGKQRKAQDLLFLALCFGGLVVTRSRGAIIGSVAAIAFIALYGRAWTLIPFAAIFAVFMKLIPSFDARVLSIFDLSRHNQRIRIWTGTLKMLRDHALFGVGPGNFEKVYPLYRLATEVEHARSPHSIYLSIFAGWGLIGGLLFWGWVWSIPARALMRKPTATEKVLIAILVAFSAHVLVDDLFAPYFPIALGVLDAVVLAKSPTRDVTPQSE